MNEDLVLAITMLIILAVVVLFIQISQQIKVKRIQKMKIQRRFGEIPDMEEVLPIEKISVYHKHQGREDVDQVPGRIFLWIRYFSGLISVTVQQERLYFTTCCTVQITGRRSGKNC